MIELKQKSGGGAAQVNSDWNAVNGVAQILNKPYINDFQGYLYYSVDPTKDTVNDIRMSRNGNAFYWQICNTGSSTKNGGVWQTVTSDSRIITPYDTTGISVDGMGSVCNIGILGYIVFPFLCNISAWNIVADGASPTCTFDIWKVAIGTALPTVANTIINVGAGGVKPFISTGNANKSTNMNNWNILISAGDIIAFNLDACTVATKISLTLLLTLPPAV